MSKSKNSLTSHSFLFLNHYATFAEAAMLSDYVIEHDANIVTIINLPLPELPYLRRAEITTYEKGILKKSESKPSFLKPAWLAYLLQSFQLLFIVFGSRRTYDVIIAQDSLLAFLGIILRTFGKCKKVIFFSHGLDRQRFKNPIFNLLYRSLDSISAERSDFNWFMSKNMIPVRRKQKVKDEAMFWIPSTVAIKTIKRKKTGEENRVVFLGTVDEKNGAPLLPKIMAQVRKSVPNAILDVMGNGPLYEWLKKEISKLNLNQSIKLLGHLSFENFSQELTRYSLGISPYKFSNDNLTPFSDSLKMRLYLAAGLPVVITKGFWFSDEIEENELGFAVEDTSDSFANAIIKLLKDKELNKEIRNKAFAYSKKMDLTGFYDRAFKKVFRTL